MAKLGHALIQTQTQVLKPQQILVSTLLQLPMLMLEQKIKTELELNPVLGRSGRVGRIFKKRKRKKSRRTRKKPKRLRKSLKPWKKARKAMKIN